MTDRECISDLQGQIDRLKKRVDEHLLYSSGHPVRSEQFESKVPVGEGEVTSPFSSDKCICDTAKIGNHPDCPVEGHGYPLDRKE